MNNLIIGSTSQLAYYFPEEYERISSRNINYEYFKNKFYDRIFLCFAEQRTYLENSQPLIFYETNVSYTLKLINFFKNKCNNIIVYSTAELWNNIEGPIDLSIPYNYNHTIYIESKHLLCKEIKKNNYRNVIILYPFNFNSIYRKSGFLFSKIFNSIETKSIIEIGDTYFYRDIIHPKYVVERSIKAIENEIVGSGRLTFINDFIRNLYSHFNLNYDDLVTENYNYNLNIKRKINYLNSKQIAYNNLFKDTIDDFKI